jgi:gas vesicle protein
LYFIFTVWLTGTRFISPGSIPGLSKEKTMKMKLDKDRNKRGVGKVLAGILLGSVVGAAVGWLTAPSSGEDLRRRLKGEMKGVKEKVRTAAGNVESKARDLTEAADKNMEEMKEAVSHRRKTTPVTTKSYE